MEMVEEHMLCVNCGEDPCVWEQHEWPIFKYADLYLPTYQPWVPRERLSHSRKRLYRKVAREIFGILGYTQRKQVARCVIRGVRAMYRYPDPAGRYLENQEHII
jgi:hypothetical protein